MIMRRRHVYRDRIKILSFRHAEQCPLVTDKPASVLVTRMIFPFTTVSHDGDSSSGHLSPELKPGA